MTTPRDPTAIIATWLEDGPADLPDPTRRAIVASIRTIPQRRGFGLPRRLPRMNGSLRLMLIAAALALAVGGVYLFSGGGNVPVAPAPSPSTAPATPTTSAAAPSPSVSAASLGLTGRIAFNRYATEASMFGDAMGLFVANADGSDERTLDIPGATDGAVLSPDGTRLLLSLTFLDGKARPAIVNIDGTGYRRLDVKGSFADMYCNAWSPEGSRILCNVGAGQKGIDGGVYSVRASDGGGLRKHNGGAPKSVEGSTSDCGGGDFAGDYSPDGTQYVFYRNWCGTGDDPSADEKAGLWVGDSTGRTDPVEVLARGVVNPHEAAPRWSPDGEWIVFGNGSNGLAVARPEGTDYRPIRMDTAGLAYYAYSPDWSPDGEWIVFSLWIDGYARSELYVVHPDGSDLTRVTTGTGTEDLVSWAVAAP